MKPLAIDLYCGLGGWTEGLLAEGYEVIGFDIEQHVYGEHRYPEQLVLQDVRTLHGRQFKDAALIVGSSPCQEFSYRAMPWKRARTLGPPVLGVELFEAQFRIQREACEAAGRLVPLVVENVRGAQPYVGRARWNFGSYYLWGDVPALMPMAKAIKNGGGSWFRLAHNTSSGVGVNPVKGPGQDWGRYGRAGQVSPHWRIEVKAQSPDHYTKPGSGPDWFDGGPAAHASGSNRRKQASALIAKIPLPLARHIAACWRPT